MNAVLLPSSVGLKIVWHGRVWVFESCQQIDTLFPGPAKICHFCAIFDKVLYGCKLQTIGSIENCMECHCCYLNGQLLDALSRDPFYIRNNCCAKKAFSFIQIVNKTEMTRMNETFKE